MALTGKVSTEAAIQAPAAKYYNFLTTQLHDLQNITEHVQLTNLHKGDDWHNNDLVMQWSYIIDGKVKSCKEKVESIDESNKTITTNLFDGDIGKDYEVFKLIFQVAEKDDGNGIIKWTIEYKKMNENVEAPHNYLALYTKIAKDIDVHVLKAN